MAHSLASLLVDEPGGGPVGGQRPGQSAVNRTVSVDEWRARIRRYNAGLDPAGQTFRAALVLIAGSFVGQNIDVLARRTGLDRAFVSRCVRRLIDNGVWVGGRAVAEWTADDPASGTFWNDVAVAEGKMCRRVRPDGSLEWAPAGFWNKNFHFLDPDADSRLGNLYLDPTSPESGRSDSDPEGPEVAANEGAPGNGPAGNGIDTQGPDLDSESDAADALPAPPAPAQDPGSLATTNGASTSRHVRPADEHAPDAQDSGEVVPSLRHVFRDAVWIG